jgi:deoxyribose-phosphate aldolase
VAEIHAALQLGAEEIDTVLDHAALLEGGDEEVTKQLLASRRACGSAVMKVILETEALQAEKWVRHAAAVAMNAGADFIKSSTGKFGAGATPEAARWMMEAVRDFHGETGRVVGVKLAGGIRTSEQAAGYVQMVDEVLDRVWLTPERFRIGASSLLGDIVNTLRGE